MNTRCFRLLAATLTPLLAIPAHATIPYTPVSLPPGAFPTTGPGVIAPKEVFGKEYSHDFDVSSTSPPVTADPQQVIAWDGIGGTADGLDYTGTRPAFTPDIDVDAIANHADALFRRVQGSHNEPETAHLIYTHDMEITGIFTDPAGGVGPVKAFLPSGPPGVDLSNGHTIGGAGEISREIAGAFSLDDHAVWATQPEINGMPDPRDVDGIEVWGPEPGFTGDADKYSMLSDFMSGASVWNLSGSPYIPHSTIVSAVESLLGPLPGLAVIDGEEQIEGPGMIDLDALMVRDVNGSNDRFDGETAAGAGMADSIIFSIDQVWDATTGSYYATGSELFVLTAGPAGAGPFGSVEFLNHGGHLWDKSYALSALEIVGPSGLLPDGVRGVIDINGIEAIGELVAVPEPTTLLLLGMCALPWAVTNRRRS